MLKHRAHLRLATTEAHRRGWKAVLRWLKEANPTADEVLRLSHADPAMQDALQQDSIHTWFQALPRDNEGGNDKDHQGH
jgi:hypothetical protein